jgi:hypothetical protein
MAEERTGPGPGDVYGDKNNAFLVFEHEECGCHFTRAICLIPTPEYSYCYLLPYRDDELGDFLFNSGYYKLDSIEPYTQMILAKPEWMPEHLKPKKAKKKRKKRAKS